MMCVRRCFRFLPALPTGLEAQGFSIPIPLNLQGSSLVWKEES